MHDPEPGDLPARERIRRLIASQPYAVLCTAGATGPHASLVACAASADLRTLVFATPIDTRKYRLLIECANVAFLLDSRSASADNLMALEAVTATGRAELVPPGPDFERWADLLASRHPGIADFIRAPSSALFAVAVDRYSHVSRFQDVCAWSPGTER